MQPGEYETKCSKAGCRRSRRDFLLAGFGGAAALAIRSPADAQGRKPTVPFKAIDVHAHFFPTVYLEALRRAGVKSFDGGVPIPNWDVASTLSDMDRCQVGTEILSLSSPALNFLDSATAVPVARAVNEEAAELVRAYPGRFGAFATLPLEDIQASLREIAYALDVLHLDGVMLPTNLNSRYLGDPHFLPLFEELHRRKTVAFLHPTSPCAECMEKLGIGLLGPVLEFTFDTSRTVVDLMTHKVFERYPDFKLILPHGGGTLPMITGRLTTGMIGVDAKATLTHLYYDTMSVEAPGLAALRRLIPLSHLLYGSDHGMTPSSVWIAAQGFQSLPDVPEVDRAVILRDNALQLFPRFARDAATTVSGK